MAVHPVASAGFSRSATAYERARPTYPEAAVDWLSQRLGLAPGRTVVDVGAGTGKLSRALLGSGAEVLAVEPLANMRAHIAAPVRALDGTAESIPLPDASADAVTVAQAFHWFDAEAALSEIHRVLRPGGALALLWNTPLAGDACNQAIEAIIAPYRDAALPYGSVRWRHVLERGSLFGTLEQATFANSQMLDAQGLAARVQSTSFISVLVTQERDRVLARVSELTAEGPVTVRYVTDVYVADRRP